MRLCASEVSLRLGMSQHEPSGLRLTPAGSDVLGRAGDEARTVGLGCATGGGDAGSVVGRMVGVGSLGRGSGSIGGVGSGRRATVNGCVGGATMYVVLVGRDDSGACLSQSLSVRVVISTTKPTKTTRRASTTLTIFVLKVARFFGTVDASADDGLATNGAGGMTGTGAAANSSCSQNSRTER